MENNANKRGGRNGYGKKEIEQLISDHAQLLDEVQKLKDIVKSQSETINQLQNELEAQREKQKSTKKGIGRLAAFLGRNKQKGSKPYKTCRFFRRTASCNGFHTNNLASSRLGII